MATAYLAIAEDIRPLPVQSSRVIQTRFDGVCSQCGCKYSKGELVLWTPPAIASKYATRPTISRMLQDDGSVVTVSMPKHKKALAEKGSIQHRNGECGSRWIVVLLWHATSKRLTVPAFAPADAVEIAILPYLDRSKPKPHPVKVNGPLEVKVLDEAGQQRFYQQVQV